MTCPTCGGSMKSKAVTTSRGDATVFECEQQNGECLNDKGYATSVWPKRGAAQQPRQRPGASSAAPTTPVRSNSNDDRSNRIERQHSQSVALKYCDLASIDPTDTEKLVGIIDWFQRDVGRMPTAPAKAAPQTHPDPDPEATAREQHFIEEPF